LTNALQQTGQKEMKKLTLLASLLNKWRHYNLINGTYITVNVQKKHKT